VDGFFESVLSHQETRGWTRFAVEHRQSGKVMGFCGLDDQTGRIDFGWRFGREFWGAGYGFEAASAVLWVAQNTFKLTQITCQSYPDNVGSIRIMEKMGMSKIGEEVVFSRPTFKRSLIGLILTKKGGPAIAGPPFFVTRVFRGDD